jgi:2',3'-cyclic-nucleotide 2'-phosphodiesterase (5'-nucleotidase family)
MPEELEIGLSPGKSIRIFYTGDLHGNVEQMKYLSTVIKKERSKSVECLLLDSGDWSQGGSLCDHFKGKPMAEIMEYLAYDAVALGEGDLSWGIRGLKNLASMVSFPFLCANLSGEPLPEIKPYICKNIQDVHIGIIGLSPAQKLLERHHSITAPEEGLKGALADLEKMKVDLVVLLSHLGIEKDRELARLFPSLHVIIGGHSHVRLDEPERAGNTLIVHGGAYGEYLGSLVLDVGTTITIKPQ